MYVGHSSSFVKDSKDLTDKLQSIRLQDNEELVSFDVSALFTSIPVNQTFLSSFLPNLCRLLIPIYDLQKKAKKFKWTEEAEKAFNEIKKLLINPPVLKAPTPDGLF